MLIILSIFNLYRLPTSGKDPIRRDPHTKVFLDRFTISDPIDEPTMLQLPASYCATIALNLLGLLEGRLIYYARIPTFTKYICRFGVSVSLRRTTFNLMYSSPIAEHMGEYKVLYRITFRFFWPRLRSDGFD